MAQLHTIVCRTRNRVSRYSDARQRLIILVNRRIERKRVHVFTQQNSVSEKTRSPVGQTLYVEHDQCYNATAKNGFARALIAIAPQYHVPRIHKIVFCNALYGPRSRTGILPRKHRVTERPREKVVSLYVPVH